MDNDFFVKVDDKEMPVCDFDYPDLDNTKNSNGGFINFVFLGSIVVTAFMWIMLVFFRK